MNDRMNEERLGDYVDGLLSESEAREVERYLATAAEARETVEFLRGLKARTAELAGSIEPRRDLWRGIAERLGPAPLASLDAAAEHESAAAPAETSSSPRTLGASSRESVLRSLWPRLDLFQWATLAAAAMVLVVSSSALTAWFITIPEATGTDLVVSDSSKGGASTVTNIALDSLHSVEVEYASQIGQLLWILYENRDTLDPDTITSIETNLRVIDRAIGRAREALEENPENAALARMLTNGYRSKLQVLERANRIIGRS